MSDFLLTSIENTFLCKPNEFERPRPGLWPSESSVEYIRNGRKIVKGKCMRAAYYRGCQVPRTSQASATLSMTGEIGKQVEQACVERWKKMRLWRGNNIKFYNPTSYISGELDCILENPETHKDFGVEVKSFYGPQAEREIFGAKKPPLAGKPKDGHFLQACIYKRDYLDILESYRLYYIDRGNGHRAEFEVGLEPEGSDFRPYWRQLDGFYWITFSEEKFLQPYLMSDIDNRLKTLIQKIKKRELPPAEFKETYNAEDVEIRYTDGEISDNKYKKYKTGEKLGDWECSYCDWTEQCRRDGRD